MTIVLTGGGSGGHITPILAVAHELKALQPDVRLVYIGQKGDALSDIPAADPNIDQVYSVRAGKFRRYHGEGLKQLLYVPTVAKNIRDAVYVVVGTLQSFWLIRRLKPTIIFTRGGFVSVPVAFGGLLNHVPYITHDSDSTPSLANRIIAKWAVKHAVALPEDVYPYPKAKTITVGVPVSKNYQSVTPELQQAYRQDLGLPSTGQLLFVTGGGNGAELLNEVVLANTEYLLQRYPQLTIVLVAGRALEASVNRSADQLLAAELRSRLQVKGFITDLHKYSGAADVVIARGGATNLAEFAIQGKACIIIPSPQLVWNIHNTKVLSDRQAVIALTQNQAEQERRLGQVVADLLDDSAKRQALASSLASFGRPDAARELAMVVLEQIKA